MREIDNLTTLFNQSIVPPNVSIRYKLDLDGEQKTGFNSSSPANLYDNVHCQSGAAQETGFNSSSPRKSRRLENSRQRHENKNSTMLRAARRGRARELATQSRSSSS